MLPPQAFMPEEGNEASQNEFPARQIVGRAMICKGFLCWTPLADRVPCGILWGGETSHLMRIKVCIPYGS